MSNSSGDRYQVSVGGSVGGHMVVGSNNSISNSPVTNFPRPTEAELARFQADVEAVQDQAIDELPRTERVKAVDQLTEFHKAATAEKPDLSTMKRVRNWFVDHAPTMVGAVTGLLVHPVVGALVKAGGDAIMSEFKDLFGGIPEVASKSHE